MDEREGEYSVLEGKPEERKPFVRHRYRWEDIIKVDLQEIGSGSVWTRFISLRTEKGGGEFL